MAYGTPERDVPRFTIADPDNPVANHTIKVIGVGGGGGNVVSHCANIGIKGVDCVAINTDQQALHALPDSARQMIIGTELCNGEGVGGDPEGGRVAAEESRRELEDIIKDARLLFVVACLGGGTGTGAAPIVAEIARERGVLAVGVVTKPFGYEGRDEIAEAGEQELRKHVNAIVTIPNENIEHEFLLNAFESVNETLVDIIKAISDLLFVTGIVNFDFKDLENNLTTEDDTALDLFVGVGDATGEKRAEEAIERAMDTSKFELDENHKASRSAILYIACLQDTSRKIGIRKSEMNLITTTVRMRMNENTQLVVGQINDQEMEPEMLRVTVIVPGKTVSEVEQDTDEVEIEAPKSLTNSFFQDYSDDESDTTGSSTTESAESRPTGGGRFRVAKQGELTDLPTLFKNQAN